MGLEDVYDCFKEDISVIMPYRDAVISGAVYEDQQRDWGLATGRGFYENSDTCGVILGKLLMYGFDTREAADIPCGRVTGFPEHPTGILDVRERRVGAMGIIMEDH